MAEKVFDLTKLGSGKEEVIQVDENTLIGIDWGSKNGDMAVMTKARKNPDGTVTFFESKVIE